MKRGDFLSAIALVLLALAIIAGIAAVLATRPQAVAIDIVPAPPSATPAPTATPAPIVIYVTGAVANPEQLVTLPAGSRAADAIMAAGGLTDDADRARVNLAAILRDGDQIHVPTLSESVDTLATPPGGVRIYINTATPEEIDALPGAGPALAQAIVAYRTTNGPFQSMEALDAVPGIGPSLLERWEGLISFE